MYIVVSLFHAVFVAKSANLEGLDDLGSSGNPGELDASRQDGHSRGMNIATDAPSALQPGWA